MKFKNLLKTEIWLESGDMRLFWVTLMLIKDRDNVVRGSIGWLSVCARVTAEECRDLLKRLEAGGWIAPQEGGGWLLTGKDNP